MMHKWESVEQMVNEWENQDIGDPFVYTDFKYDMAEFDNVPPMVPRFLFRMQQYLRSMTVFIKGLRDSQSVGQLREETLDLIKNNRVNFTKQQDNFNSQQKKMSENLKDLQKQIDQINKANQMRELDHVNKSYESLMLPTDFNYNPEAQSAADPAADSQEISQYEVDNASYLKNMSSGRFKEPRMFTMQQIRNMVFAVVNQSRLAQRVADNEDRHDKVDQTCKQLDETDKKLDQQAKSIHNELIEKIKKWKSDFILLQKQNVRHLEEHDTNLQNHTEVLERYKEMLDEQKRSIGTNFDHINRVAVKLEKARDSLLNDIQITREEMIIKIEHNDRFVLEEFQKVKEVANQDKQVASSAVEKLREDFNGSLKRELDEVKKLVDAMTSQATEHRETLQEEYSQKLEKIKAIVTQYFAKYEKHLMQQQDLCTELEKRQQLWIKKLIKPQDCNEARLFSLDTRIKEGELSRINDQQFIKETMKKLIFAVEQSALSKSHQNQLQQEQQSQMLKTDDNWMEISNYPNLDHQQSKRTDKTIVLKSVADHNFGSIDNSMQAMLPTIGSENSTQRKTEIGDFNWSTSFLESRSNSRSTAPNQNTSDLIFLRRLLFLKQSLDLESGEASQIEADQAFRLHKSEFENDGFISSPQTEQKNINSITKYSNSIRNEDQDIDNAQNLLALPLSPVRPMHAAKACALHEKPKTSSRQYRIQNARPRNRLNQSLDVGRGHSQNRARIQLRLTGILEQNKFQTDRDIELDQLKALEVQKQNELKQMQKLNQDL